MARYKFSDIAINSTAKKKPVESDKYVYIGLEHLDSQCLQVNRYGSEVAPIGEKLVMKKGDVLFGKRRAYQKKVAIAPFDGIFSAHGMVLRPKEKVIDKDYFPFFISSDYFLDNSIKISVGSLSPTINWGDLKNLEFDLPNIEEQKKLAKILWAAEELKQKYYNNIEHIEFLESCSFNKFLHEIKKTGKFKNEKLKDISNKTAKSKFAASAGQIEGEFPFFLSGKGILRIDSFISDGKMILCNDGGSAMFRYYVGPCSYSDHVFGFKINDDRIELKYVYYYLNNFTKYINEFLFKGTGLKNIDKKAFFDFDIIIPELEQQNKIIRVIDKYVEIKEQSSTLIENIKAIQSNLINGGQINV